MQLMKTTMAAMAPHPPSSSSAAGKTAGGNIASSAHSPYPTGSTRLGPERPVYFHNYPDPTSYDEHGVCLIHDVADGRARIRLREDARSPGGNLSTLGIVEGRLRDGDVVLEAAGVDMRRPISVHMWKLTMGLMRVAPRPIEVVVAREYGEGEEFDEEDNEEDAAAKARSNNGGGTAMTDDEDSEGVSERREDAVVAEGSYIQLEVGGDGARNGAMALHRLPSSPGAHPHAHAPMMTPLSSPGNVSSIGNSPASHASHSSSPSMHLATVRNPFLDPGRFGPERTITFHTESLGIKLHRSPTEGIAHVLHVIPYRSLANEPPPRDGPDGGRLEAGDAIVEVGGVDLRGKAIGVAEWADMVYFIKTVGRPLEMVVAKDALFTRERAGVMTPLDVAVTAGGLPALPAEDASMGEEEEEEDRENVEPNVIIAEDGGLRAVKGPALADNDDGEVGVDEEPEVADECAAQDGPRFDVAADDICNLACGGDDNEGEDSLVDYSDLAMPSSKKDRPWKLAAQKDDDDEEEAEDEEAASPLVGYADNDDHAGVDDPMTITPSAVNVDTPSNAEAVAPPSPGFEITTPPSTKAKRDDSWIKRWSTPTPPPNDDASVDDADDGAASPVTAAATGRRDRPWTSKASSPIEDDSRQVSSGPAPPATPVSVAEESVNEVAVAATSPTTPGSFAPASPLAEFGGGVWTTSPVTPAEFARSVALSISPEGGRSAVVDSPIVSALNGTYPGGADVTSAFAAEDIGTGIAQPPGRKGDLLIPPKGDGIHEKAADAETKPAHIPFYARTHPAAVAATTAPSCPPEAGKQPALTANSIGGDDPFATSLNDVDSADDGRGGDASSKAATATLTAGPQSPSSPHAKPPTSPKVLVVESVETNEKKEEGQQQELPASLTSADQIKQMFSPIQKPKLTAGTANKESLLLAPASPGGKKGKDRSEEPVIVAQTEGGASSHGITTSPPSSPKPLIDSPTRSPIQYANSSIILATNTEDTVPISNVTPRAGAILAPSSSPRIFFPSSPGDGRGRSQPATKSVAGKAESRNDAGTPRSPRSLPPLDPTPSRPTQRLDPTPSKQTPKKEPTPRGGEGAGGADLSTPLDNCCGAVDITEESPFHSVFLKNLHHEFKSPDKTLRASESRDDDEADHPPRATATAANKEFDVSKLGDTMVIPKPEKRNHLLSNWAVESKQQHQQQQKCQQQLGQRDQLTVTVKDEAKKMNKGMSSMTTPAANKKSKAGTIRPPLSERTFRRQVDAESPFAGNVNFGTHSPANSSAASRRREQQQHRVMPQSSLFSQAFVVQQQQQEAAAAAAKAATGGSKGDEDRDDGFPDIPVCGDIVRWFQAGSPLFIANAMDNGCGSLSPYLQFSSPGTCPPPPSGTKGDNEDGNKDKLNTSAFDMSSVEEVEVDVAATDRKESRLDETIVYADLGLGEDGYGGIDCCGVNDALCSGNGFCGTGGTMFEGLVSSPQRKPSEDAVFIRAKEKANGVTSPRRKGLLSRLRKSKLGKKGKKKEVETEMEYYGNLDNEELEEQRHPSNGFDRPHSQEAGVGGKIRKANVQLTYQKITGQSKTVHRANQFTMLVDDEICV